MNIKLTENPLVKKKFEKYPDKVKGKMAYLRKLILEVAEEISEINELEETLKWGEPSYLTKIGSTLRMDWKEKNPDQYAMYFKCTSKLVPAFREVFGEIFKYEKTRAILFGMDDNIPEKELKKCIAAALTYHKIKHIPSLGLD